MDVVIAGGHGKIGRLLGQLLTDDGHRVRGMIRNPDHAADLEAIAVESVVFDLERDDGLAALIEGADAAVFAAGAGPGSGAQRKQTMDRDGAIKLIDACRETGTARYVMVSSMGARPGVTGDDVFSVYLRMKFEADEALRASGLDYTILRPGRLTDEPGTGRIALAPDLPSRSIPRADVAATLAIVLRAPNTSGKSFDLTTGTLPIAEAVRTA
ncbi:MAG TPA: SDR family oxidoreductase [Thermoleophilaceae bacterium]|nr:SDR family oxidoreductase [Thermoleophilaceae bacterium]